MHLRTPHGTHVNTTDRDSDMCVVVIDNTSVDVDAYLFTSLLCVSYESWNVCVVARTCYTGVHTYTLMCILKGYRVHVPEPAGCDGFPDSQ